MSPLFQKTRPRQGAQEAPDAAGHGETPEAMAVSEPRQPVPNEEREADVGQRRQHDDHTGVQLVRQRPTPPQDDGHPAADELGQPHQPLQQLRRWQSGAAQSQLR